MSIDVNSTTINFNGANIKIASSGKGIIFADGTTLSSNTEIGGGGSSNLAQVVDLGNTTSNTLLLENTNRTIVSSGNIESNIITTIIRFQEGSELPDGQGITLESAANNGNTVSNVVQFSNGFVVSNGFVGIGTTSPSANLHVVGNTYIANDITLGSNINIRSTQTNTVINIGRGTGQINQSSDCMAFGDLAGNSNQGLRAIAFGNNSGKIDQGTYALAFGNAAGNNLQGARAVAIGTSAGNSSQGVNSVAIGRQAGQTGQNNYCVAIGSDAGTTDQGVHSIAIGYLSNALDNSVVLNASGSELYPSTSDGFFVKPIKMDQSKTSNVITYDPSTGELFDSGGSGGGGSSNLQQVVDLGNATSNTLILENATTTIVSSGNIESNIVTTAIYFGDGTYTSEVATSNLENVTSRGADTTAQVNFKGGFVVESNLSADVYGDLTTNTVSTNDIVVSTSERSPIISTGVMTIEADSKTYTVHSNTFNTDITGFTVSNLINGGQVVLNLYNTDSSSHDVSPGSGKLTSFSGTLTVPSANNAIFTITKVNSNIFVNGGIFS